MRQFLHRLYGSVTRDDLLLRVICFLGGLLAAGMGVGLFAFVAMGDFNSLFARVLCWVITIFFMSYGGLMLLRCVLSARSRTARFTERFLPDAVDLEAGALLALLIYLPAVLLTLLLHWVGVKGQRINWDRRFR